MADAKIAKQEDDIFNEENKLESGRVQWGKIGDFVKGTYIDKRDIKYDDGKTGYIYELLASGGEYHTITDDDAGNAVIAEKGTVIENGDYVRVSGKKGIDDEMKKVKIGQKVGLRFEGMGKKVAGKKPFKDVKVYRGAMDDAWLEEQSKGDELFNQDTPFS
jgi:hypothetical protein